ncbi:MAG: glutathione S-transferase, partial [Rhizobiales bacterium]|nr:glutathione S-transferase [Hyphomicrobiales bacterium]
MKLYGSKTSPFVRKIRVLAAEFHLPVTFIPEDPWAKSEL